MITTDDVHYHAPPTGDLTWAETNFFAFYLPERNICGSLYVVARQPLGIALADVTIFDRVSLDRRDCLYVDSQPYLAAPNRLDDYALSNGLSVRCTRAPGDYELHYEGMDGVGFDLAFRAVMSPYDVHDAGVDPGAARAADEGGRGAFQLESYSGGHFDITGRVTGMLALRGERFEIDCLDTMDHSWGPRGHNPNGAMGAWLHAHFGDDAMHCIFAFDPLARPTEQYQFVRGYILEGGKVLGASAGRARATRIDGLANTVQVTLTDVAGRRRSYAGAAVAATNAHWYPHLDTHYALHRWTAEDGREGHGCWQETFRLSTLLRSNAPLL